MKPAPSRPRAAPPPAGGALATLRKRFDEPKFAAVAVLAMIAGSAIGALALIPGGRFGEREASTQQTPGQKLDGRLASAGTITAADAEIQAPMSTEGTRNIVTPEMEQPYLVVLATRPGTEALQEDFLEFKSAYPDLLAATKARVDRIQGQDQKTWYRLSLIPPRSQADAKALCASLRSAGLTGCWIRRVPLDNGAP